MENSKNEYDYLIKRYSMIEHPEGGFYVETFRSDINVEVKLNSQDVVIRPASTCIYFLIVSGNFSRLHRIKSDEVWHFYLGGPMTVVEIDENGCRETILGNNIEKGEIVQYCVKRDTWFGSFPNEGTSYSFVGCSVSPGFVYEDFELASRSKLLEEFPNSRDMIIKLTEGLP